MVGVGRTVKGTALLATPPTVTTTLPDVAVAGTGTVMLVELQFVGAAEIPLKLTVLVTCVDPKLAPVIVTGVPTAPDVGFRLAMLGPELVTVNPTPLLAKPPTVTTTFPVVAPVGTGTMMLVALQLVGVAAIPLKVTVLVPCVAPKLVPVIVTEFPTAPDAGFRLVRLGLTVKATPLLATPLTVTTTFPVVAPAGTGTLMLVELHAVGLPTVPLNATVLEPWAEPNPVPLIVIELPTGPKELLRLEMLGVTENNAPLLETPPTVTTTFPVVAATGTGTVMNVCPH